MFRTLSIVLALSFAYVAAVELYSDQFDHINAEEIVANDVVREQYYDCFMDTAPCLTPDAVFFKGNFPEALVTKCARCTDKQKQMFSVIVEWYTSNQEEKWNALVAKTLEDAKRMKIAGA